MTEDDMEKLLKPFATFLARLISEQLSDDLILVYTSDGFANMQIWDNYTDTSPGYINVQAIATEVIKEWMDDR
jgi:hypothetical protein